MSPLRYLTIPLAALVALIVFENGAGGAYSLIAGAITLVAIGVVKLHLSLRGAERIPMP